MLPRPEPQSQKIPFFAGWLNPRPPVSIVSDVRYRELGLLAPSLAALVFLTSPAPGLAQELTEARRIEVARHLAESSVTVTVRGRGTGSGFVIGQERWIVTNAHVVGSSARRPITVLFRGDVALPASVLAYAERLDLAILRCDGEVPVHPLMLADSSRVQVGQSVLAYGSPHGLTGTLTQGIVSALRDGLPGVGDGAVSGLIQTDAPINPGNSGGPLVDARGEVIGVNSLIVSRTGGSEGIGFALPSNLVRDLLAEVRTELAERERAAPAGEGVAVTPTEVDGTSASATAVLPVWLGIEGEDFRGFGLRGVRVQRVIPGGPAAAAGLRGAEDPPPAIVLRRRMPWTGYVILAMDGHPVRGWRDLVHELGDRHPGDRAILTLAVPPGALTGDTVVELTSPPGR